MSEDLKQSFVIQADFPLIFLSKNKLMHNMRNPKNKVEQVF